MSDLIPMSARPPALDGAGSMLVPVLVADLGDAAAWRYVEFFTANIRNPNTRRAYVRACGHFLSWCERRGLTLAAIRPFDVAAYVKGLQAAVSAPRVKQQLAAIRMLCDWLVTGQVIPANPASSVRRAASVCAEDRGWHVTSRRVFSAIPEDRC